MNSKDLDVRVFPVDLQSVVIIVKVQAMQTPANSLKSNQGVVLALAFDYIERGIMPLDRTGQEAYFV